MDVQDAAALATAFGLFVVVAQVALTRREARLSFEDAVSREFRVILSEFPLELFLPSVGSTTAIPNSARRAILSYLDLSNEQAHLRAKGRISSSAWRDWSVGISEMLEWSQIRDVWAELRATRPRHLSALERLEDEGFRDPISWVSRWNRARRWVGSLIGYDVRACYVAQTRPTVID